MHKSEIIKAEIQKQKSEYIEIHNPADLKMRPIVAGPTSITSKLSSFLDTLLKPLLRSVKGNIRNTVDFLNNLPKKS